MAILASFRQIEHTFLDGHLFWILQPRTRRSFVVSVAVSFVVSVAVLFWIFRGFSSDIAGGRHGRPDHSSVRRHARPFVVKKKHLDRYFQHFSSSFAGIFLNFVEYILKNLENS